MTNREDLLPARWAPGGGGSGGVRLIDALVTDKETVGTVEDEEIRGRYTCVEIEWLSDGTWQEKEGGRTFVNCYELSTGSNANIQVTRTNIVVLRKVRTVEESSSSESEAEVESSSSSSSANIDRSVYVFDKALGGILRPARV